jgi:hypothetical protein
VRSLLRDCGLAGKRQLNRDEFEALYLAILKVRHARVHLVCRFLCTRVSCLHSWFLCACVQGCGCCCGSVGGWWVGYPTGCVDVWCIAV